MSDEAAAPVLRRMAGRRATAAGLSEMTIAKALRFAVARAGDDVLGLPVGLRDLAEARVMPDNLAEALPDPALLVSLVDECGARGLAVACPQVLGAVIEAQTIGKVQARPAAERLPTRTDAVLIGAFLDRLMKGFANLVSACPDPPPVDGFHCASPLADAHAVKMSLADAAHLRLEVELDFDGGAKRGRLQLVYPAERAEAVGRSDGGDWKARLETVVLGTCARLEAELCKLKMPLDEVIALAPGDCVTLHGARLDGVSLVGADGKTVMQAKLGRSGPVRAVRLDCAGNVARKANVPVAIAELPGASTAGGPAQPEVAPAGIKPSALPLEAAAMDLPPVPEPAEMG